MEQVRQTPLNTAVNSLINSLKGKSIKLRHFKSYITAVNAAVFLCELFLIDF